MSPSPVRKTAEGERRDTRVFSALADPTRRSILRFLRATDEATAGEIAGAVPQIGRTAVSMHLRALKDADLLAERRDGRFRRYRLGPNRADEVVDFLLEVYEDSLGQLKAAAEAKTKQP